MQNRRVNQIAFSPPVMPPNSLPGRTPSAAPGSVLPSLLFFLTTFCLSYFSNSSKSFSLSFLDSHRCFSFPDHLVPFHSHFPTPYCLLKGKPSCFTYSVSPPPPVVALPVITILLSLLSRSPPFSWHSSFFSGLCLTNRFTPLYPN